MKIEREAVPLDQFDIVWRTPGRNEASKKVADEIYEDFKKLIQKKMGKIITLEEHDDGPWPSLVEFKKMSKEERKFITNRVTVRTQRLRFYLRKKAAEDKITNFHIIASYIGDGKILLWWRLKEITVL